MDPGIQLGAFMAMMSDSKPMLLKPDGKMVRTEHPTGTGDVLKPSKGRKWCDVIAEDRKTGGVATIPRWTVTYIEVKYPNTARLRIPAWIDRQMMTLERQMYLEAVYRWLDKNKEQVIEWCEETTDEE